MQTVNLLNFIKEEGNTLQEVDSKIVTQLSTHIHSIKLEPKISDDMQYLGSQIAVHMGDVFEQTYEFIYLSTKFMSICNKPNLALYLLHSAIFSYGTWNNHIQMMLEKLNISMAVPLSSNPMHARHEVTVPSIRSTFGMLKSSLVTVNILVHRADPRMANETKYQNKNFFDHLNSIVRRFSIFERSDPDEPSYPFVRNSLPRGHLFGAIHQADPGLANILFANQ